MIPVRLKMRNFMCYRDDVPPLEFGDIHIACISGDNGNGKSAIIDAMTWALWGKARAASDDDLIYSSQPEMEVEFEFTAGTQRYRIIRKRSRPKKRGGAGQSSLDLMIAGDDGYRAISGNTIAQTQNAIKDDILHMDYDTFINSAYLRQGHADEFTRQAPARRKEVLGNILGLSFYDELEDRARERARSLQADSTRLEYSLTEINGELSHKPDYEVELKEAESLLADIDNKVKEKESLLNELRQQKSALENMRQQLNELENRLASGTRDLERWQEQFDRHLERIGAYEAIIARRDDIEQGFIRYGETRKINDEFYKNSQASRGLELKKSQLETALEKKIQALNQEHALVRQKISELEDREGQLPELKVRLNQIQTEVNSLAGAESQLKEKEASLQESQQRVIYLEAEKSRLEREIGELNEKLDLIASHVESHTEARCPLCEQELSREGLELITQKYTREKMEKAASMEESGAELSHQRETAAALQEEITRFEAELEQRKTGIRSREEVIKNRISEIEADAPKLADLRETLSEIEERLAGRDFAAAEQEAIADIEEQLKKLDYNPEKHEAARKQLEELEPFQREKSALDEALRLIGSEKKAADQAEEAARNLGESLEKDRQKREELSAGLTRLPQLLQEVTDIETEYRALTAQRNQSQEAVGQVKARLERCARLETSKKETESQLKEVSKEESIYSELARAFGKAGIQALLIETALPEIEDEANDLLARMTDNRMHVKFETQKETKKGTVHETLDITIADELGTRSYEMFSGGEAFRINFAIRIALSRLLARRAGAPLPTLIIDEGFGTQDSTGLEKLKEAINTIQNDFQKILVITHMDELKDAFPVRIDVVKTAGGSTISVN